MQEPFITTYEGRMVHALDPNPGELYIDDIAHALSNICRFTGHVASFYSVAQHSVLVSRRLPVQHRLWGLLHDASEAFFADIASPFKWAMPDYRRHEERLMFSVAERFGLCWPMPQCVHDIDKMIVTDEALCLFKRPPAWAFERSRLGIYIEPLPPAEAKELFMGEFRDLTAGVSHAAVA